MKSQKIKFSVLLVAFAAMFFSCSKNDAAFEEDLSIKIQNSEFGPYHNKVLARFHQQGFHKSGMTLEAKVSLIDSFLAEEVDFIEVGMFTEIVFNGSVDVFSLLEEIHNSQDPNETSHLRMTEFYENNEISSKEFHYSKEVYEAFKEFDNELEELNNKLLLIESNIKSDHSLSLNERKNLERVLSIAVSSFDYWTNDLTNPYLVDKSWWSSLVNRLRRDVSGAWIAVTTGIAAQAAVIVPGYGAIVATLGLAVFCSAI